MKTVDIEQREKIEEILNTAKICFAGITDLEGNPYVFPMNFGYRNGTIYLHSGPTGSWLPMIEKNNHICITISIDHDLVFQNEEVACSYRMKAKSVVCRGKVEFIQDVESKRQALDIIMEHYTTRKFSYSDPAVENVKIWKIEIENMTAKEYGIPYYQ